MRQQTFEAALNEIKRLSTDVMVDILERAGGGSDADKKATAQKAFEDMAEAIAQIAVVAHKALKRD